MKAGELFAGYGGLALAVESVFNAETAWVAEWDEAPSKILAHHWPGTPNHRDVTAVDWATIEQVQIISGGSPCFVAGTLVDTTSGYKRIEDLTVGEKVKTHTGRYMPIVQTMNRYAHGDAISLKVMGAPPITTTEEHPFWVRTKTIAYENRTRVRKFSTPEWVAAGDLTNNHFVGFQLDTPGNDEVLGVNRAYIVGRWLGDGWVRNGKRSSPAPQGQRGSRVNSRWWQFFICCAHGEADELAEKFSDADFAPARFDERTVTKFRVNSKEFVHLLQQFGKHAHGKKIPGWVYNIPIIEQAALLQGWVDSDGSVQKSDQIRVTTVSEELAHGMARIARNVYQRAVSVHKFDVPDKTVIEGRVVNQRPQFQLCIPVSNRESFVDDGWVWCPVRRVEKATDVEVFNIGVAEDESYTAYGIAVHNCQDVSTAGARRGMTEGTRSNLWVAMREAIATQKPDLVVWENVRGAFSATATSNLEPCPGCMGETMDREPVLRALGRVLGDLSTLGYDAQWRTIRVSDIGGAHQRARVFILAHHRNSYTIRERWSQGGARPHQDNQVANNSRDLVERATSGNTGKSAQEIALFHTGEKLLPTPNTMDSLDWREGEARKRAVNRGRDAGAGKRTGNLREEVHFDFREYTSAIKHWEAVIGRQAPPAATPSKNGRPQLNPRFSEWLMGLPDGWVTSPQIGLTRAQQLKAIGNGVVPQQAAAALTEMWANLQPNTQKGAHHT